MFSSDILERNRELAGRINQEVRADPNHPYKGRIAGIANGRVVAVADSLNEIGRLLEQIEPDNTRTYVLEPGMDYSQVETIWEIADAPHPLASPSWQAEN